MREIKVAPYGVNSYEDPMRQANRAGVLARVIFRPHAKRPQERLVVIDQDVRPGTHLRRAAESGAVAGDYDESYKDALTKAAEHTGSQLEGEESAAQESATRSIVNVDLPEAPQNAAVSSSR